MKRIQKSINQPVILRMYRGPYFIAMLLLLHFSVQAQTQNMFTILSGPIVRHGETIIIKNNEADINTDRCIWTIGTGNANIYTQYDHVDTMCFLAENTTNEHIILPVKLEVYYYGMSKSKYYIDTVLILSNINSPGQNNIIYLPMKAGQFNKYYPQNATCRHFISSSSTIDLDFNDALQVNFNENSGQEPLFSNINVTLGNQKEGVLSFKQDNTDYVPVEVVEISAISPPTILPVNENAPAIFTIYPYQEIEGSLFNVGKDFTFTIEPQLPNDTNYFVTLLRIVEDAQQQRSVITNLYTGSVIHIDGEGMGTQHEVVKMYGMLNYNNPMNSGTFTLTTSTRDFAPYVEKVEIYSVINNKKNDLPFYKSEWKFENGKLVCQGTLNNCLVHMPENQLEIHVYTSEEMASFDAKLLEEPGTSVDIDFDAAKSSNNTYVYNCNKSLFNANNLYTIELTGEDITGNQLMPLADKEIKYTLKYKLGDEQPVTFADNQKDISHTFHILNYNGGNADECPSVLYFDYDIVDKTVTFTNLSILNGDIGARCNWKFSEAGSYTYNPNTTVTHTYTKNGTYEVTLQVTENTTGVYRGLDKFIKNVTIQTNFQSDFADVKIKFEAIEHPSSLPPHKRSVKLKYISTIDDIADVQWTLDGSAPVSDLMPEFICVLNITYTVNLTLTFNDSSTISKTVKIIVNNADGIIIP